MRQLTRKRPYHKLLNSSKFARATINEHIKRRRLIGCPATYNVRDNKEMIVNPLFQRWIMCIEHKKIIQIGVTSVEIKFKKGKQAIRNMKCLSPVTDLHFHLRNQNQVCSLWIWKTWWLDHQEHHQGNLWLYHQSERKW